jgi:hypothetical protein
MTLSITNACGALKWIVRNPVRHKSPGDSYLKRFVQGWTLGRQLMALAQRTSRETDDMPDTPFLRTEFEKSIPFVKDSVYLYMSYAPFFVLSIYFIKDRKNFERAAQSMRALSEISIMFYHKYPAHFPHGRKINRELTRWKPDDLLYRFCYNFDSGNNTFPSQHVNLSILCGLILLRGGYRRSGKLMLLWSILIAASTLTTKQHFQIDIPAALLLASKVKQRFSAMQKMPTPQEFEEIKKEIFAEADALLQNLIKGNYHPAPRERKNLIRHIDPAVIEIMQNIRSLNPLSPIYSEIIENTLEMLLRS